MISGGTSCLLLEVRRATSDMGRRGLAIQEGWAVFGAAIVGLQKLASSRPARPPRRRLRRGRRSVPSSPDFLRTVSRSQTTATCKLTAIGARGAVLVEIRSAQDRARGDDFIAPGHQAVFRRSGDVIDVAAGTPSPAVAGSRVGRRTGYAWWPN